MLGYPNHSMSKSKKPTEPVVTRVEFTLRNPDGTYTTRRLTGQAALQWYKYTRELSILAAEKNPKFEELDWKVYTTKKNV